MKSVPYFYLTNAHEKALLQDFLDYFCIREFRGTYQLPSLDKISVGLEYMAKAIDQVTSCMGEAAASTFGKVLINNTVARMHNLENYYFSIDMADAEKLWQEKLSNTHLKRLDYILKKVGH